MVVNYNGYLFDFKNMYFWADLPNRLQYLNNKIDFVHFKLGYHHEIKYIGGSIKTWDDENNEWTDIYPANLNHRKEINRLFENYLFETNVLEQK